MRRFSNGVAIGVHEKRANAWFRDRWDGVHSWANPSTILGPSGLEKKKNRTETALVRKVSRLETMAKCNWSARSADRSLERRLQQKWQQEHQSPAVV
jgi:hypothetical protein